MKDWSSMYSAPLRQFCAFLCRCSLWIAVSGSVSNHWQRLILPSTSGPIAWYDIHAKVSLGGHGPVQLCESMSAASESITILHLLTTGVVPRSTGRLHQPSRYETHCRGSFRANHSAPPPKIGNTREHDGTLQAESCCSCWHQNRERRAPESPAFCACHRRLCESVRRNSTSEKVRTQSDLDVLSLDTKRRKAVERERETEEKRYTLCTSLNLQGGVVWPCSGLVILHSAAKKNQYTLTARRTVTLQAGYTIFGVNSLILRCPFQMCRVGSHEHTERRTHGTRPACLKPAGVMEDRKVLACVLQPSVVHASQEEAAKEGDHAVTVFCSFCTMQYGKKRSGYTCHYTFQASFRRTSHSMYITHIQSRVRCPRLNWCSFFCCCWGAHLRSRSFHYHNHLFPLLVVVL